MWGFSPGEFRGRFEQIDARVHPDDRPRVRAEWTAAVAAGLVFEHEFRVVWPDGTVRQLASRGRAWRDGAGRPARVRGVTVDVTERRGGGPAPRAGEERLRAALLNARGAMFGQDLELRYTWARGVDEGALDRLLGKTDAELFSPADARRLTAFKRAVLASGRGARAELRLAGGGGPRRYDVTIEPQRDAEGRVVGLAWATWGASPAERPRDEARLLAALGADLGGVLDVGQAASALARFVARELADACVVDLPGGPGEAPRCELARRDSASGAACVEAPGLDPGAGGGPDARGAPAPTEGARADAPRPSAPVPVDGGPDEGLPRALRELGARSYLAVPLPARGRVLGTLVLISADAGRRYGPDDLSIAEQIAERAALAIDNARLYAAARREVEARDEALGAVAHELRGPLNLIRLHAQLLQDAAPGARGAGVVGALDEIGRASERASRLLQDLLDVRRVDGGALTIERTRLDPKPFVLEAIRSHRAPAAAASVVIVGQFEGSLPPLWADRDRLLQALENLVSNALKFTPPGGRVTLGVSARDGEALFRVSDTGEGIDAASLPRVFERFWQGRPADRRGAGLGLPICKAIVEAHGGRIWAESEPGVGTTFSFTVPLGP